MAYIMIDQRIVDAQHARIVQLEAECAANDAWIKKLEDAANRLQNVFGADDMHQFSPAGSDVSLAPARLADDWRKQRARIEQLEAECAERAEAFAKLSAAHGRVCGERDALQAVMKEAVARVVADQEWLDQRPMAPNDYARGYRRAGQLHNSYWRQILAPFMDADATADDPTHEPGWLTPLSARVSNHVKADPMAFISNLHPNYPRKDSSEPTTDQLIAQLRVAFEVDTSQAITWIEEWFATHVGESDDDG